MAVRREQLPLAPGFSGRVQRQGECLIWTGSVDSDGYGMLGMRLDGHRYQRAHRIAYVLATGDHPGELFVCHRCDTPSCVEPAHLFLGDAAANNADMMAKGRNRHLSGADHPARRHPENVPRGDAHYARRRPEAVRRGARHPLARLTPEQVAEMRERYACGGVTFAALGDEYGVTKAHAHAVVRGRFWKVAA